VLEFLVAILAGLEDLWDISLSSRPLDKDSAVAGSCASIPSAVSEEAVDRLASYSLSPLSTPGGM
jgi:hypothetical protein